MYSSAEPAATLLTCAEPVHPFLMTDPEIRAVFSDPLYRDLIASAPFQRLRHIRFLGAIDYLFRPNGKSLNTRHTRYQHSLGVALLARRLSVEVGWSQPTERAFVAAALLHDIGHGPLSHSLEPVFREHFQIDHHLATLAVITTGHDGRAPLAKILSAHGVEANRVIDMISNREGEWSPLFLGKFNLDTLEAISRCATYLLRNPLIAPPWAILRAAHIGATDSPATLDAFWNLKNLVYSRLILSPTGVRADLNSQDFARKHLGEFKRDHFFANERELRRLHPGLFSRLNAPRWDRVAVSLRRFEIDVERDSLDERYVERRQEVTIDYAYRPQDLGLDGTAADRLFDDDRFAPRH
jgi:uncharacterized protein